MRNTFKVYVQVNLKPFFLIFIRLWGTASFWSFRCFSDRGWPGGTRGGVAMAGQHPDPIQTPLWWHSPQQRLGAHCHTLLLPSPVSPLKVTVRALCTNNWGGGLYRNVIGVKVNADRVCFYLCICCFFYSFLLCPDGSA